MPDTKKKVKVKKVSVKSKIREKRRRERARKIRRITFASLVALILLGVMVYVWFVPGEATSVDIKLLQETNGLKAVFTIDTSGPNSFSGDVTLKTVRDNQNVTYTARKHVEGNGGYFDLPYTKFVDENGQYSVRISAGSAAASVEYPVDFVVEDLTFLKGGRSERGRYNLTVFISLIRYTSSGNTTVEVPPDEGLSVKLYDETGGYVDLSKESHLTPTVSISYTVPKAGNYTMKAVYVNPWVKETSRYFIVKNSTDMYINAVPYAEAGPNQTVKYVPFVGAKVKVDASGSIDDGRIVEYWWDFGVNDDPEYTDDIVVSSSPTAEYTYTEIGTYIVTLRITDDAGNMAVDDLKVIVF